MKYRILDCDGNVVARVGSLAKAERVAADYQRARGYYSRDFLMRRYCYIERIE